jgi:hypothetical protein
MKISLHLLPGNPTQKGVSARPHPAANNDTNANILMEGIFWSDAIATYEPTAKPLNRAGACLYPLTMTSNMLIKAYKTGSTILLSARGTSLEHDSSFAVSNLLM